MHAFIVVEKEGQEKARKAQLAMQALRSGYETSMLALRDEVDLYRTRMVNQHKHKRAITAQAKTLTGLHAHAAASRLDQLSHEAVVAREGRLLAATVEALAHLPASIIALYGHITLDSPPY